MNIDLDVKALRAKFDNHEMILPEEFADLLTRLEQAEQAVARVREVAAGWATNDRPFREAILRALDGDTRG